MPRPMKELAEVERHVSTLYASLELSQSTWLVTSLSPGSTTMSKHSITYGRPLGNWEEQVCAENTQDFSQKQRKA